MTASEADLLATDLLGRVWAGHPTCAGTAVRLYQRAARINATKESYRVVPD